MREIIKKIITDYFPELATGHHLPRFAEVVGIGDTPSAGDESNDWTPLYSVHLKLLKQNGKHDKTPIYKDVPLPIPTGNSSMGLYGYPNIGTWVIIMFAYGSQAHPVIMNILPHNRTMPTVAPEELLLQLNEKSFLRTTKSGNQRLIAENKLHVGNGTVNVLAELRELARLFKIHKHPGIAVGLSSTKVSDQSSGAEEVESKVDSITE